MFEFGLGVVNESQPWRGFLYTGALSWRNAGEKPLEKAAAR